MQFGCVEPVVAAAVGAAILCEGLSKGQYRLSKVHRSNGGGGGEAKLGKSVLCGSSGRFPRLVFD